MSETAAWPEWMEHVKVCIEETVLMRHPYPLEHIARMLVDPSFQESRSLSTADYVQQHNIEEQMTSAINQAFTPGQPAPSDVLSRLSDLLRTATRGDPQPSVAPSAPSAPSGPSRLVLPPLEDDASSGDWSLLSWLQAIGTHRVVAAAIAQQAGSSDTATTLQFLRGLKGRDEVAQMLRTEAAIETQVDVVWGAVEKLQQAGAATNEEVNGKFEGAIDMEYKGLNAYFGGLEGVVGGPSQKILEGMRADHVSGSESDEFFTTGNYGVRTTSKTEWLFVTDDDDAAALAKLGLQSWPAESAEKLPDRSHFRKRRPLADVKRAADETNARLRRDGTAELIDEELIAAIMYTGPMFVKYNAVLRGLRSTVHFLRNTMISHCCPKAVADEYLGTAKVFQQPYDGKITFDEAKKSLNKYATTLHGINSAIIKLGKLTIATKVYRGVAGMKLPDEFWTANEFGVKAGVEHGFMSTTLDRGVAMGYAKGDGSRMGIVIEARQGMVNRGAAISWLSQYPHEEEILFGPLTGIEVLSTRIDDSVVIIECAFNVNLTTLTLEKVLNKRHRLLEDMSQNIVLEVPSTLAGTGLEQEAESRQGKLTEEMRSSILDQRPEQYNDDSRFREAVEKILKVKSSQIGTVKILEDMRNLKPPELKKHATFVVAQLSESSADVHDAKAIRDAAVETLGKLDKPDLALWAPKFMDLLADAHEEVQCAVLDVLKFLAPEELLKYADVIFTHMAERACSDLVRSHCAKALSRLQDQERLDRSALLAYSIHKKHAKSETGSRIRGNVRELLCYAPSALLHAFRDEDANERFSALHVLSYLVLKLSERGISHTPWLNGAAELLTDDDEDVRAKAVEVFKTVVKTEPSAAEAYVERALNSLEDSTDKVRRMGAKFLLYLEPCQFAEHFAFIRRSLSSPTDDVRYEVVQAIHLGIKHDPGLRKTPGVEAELRRLLEDKDSGVVERAENAVKMLEEQKAAEKIQARYRGNMSRQR